MSKLTCIVIYGVYPPLFKKKKKIMNEKWVEGGNLSWHFPPRCDYSDTLPIKNAKYEPRT